VAANLTTSNTSGVFWENIDMKFCAIVWKIVTNKSVTGCVFWGVKML